MIYSLGQFWRFNNMDGMDLKNKKGNRRYSAVCHFVSKTNEDETAVDICGYTLACIEHADVQHVGLGLTDMFEYCMSNNIRTIYLHDFNVEGDFIIQFLFNLGLELVNGQPNNGQFSVFKVQNKLYKITATFDRCCFKFLGSRNIIHSSVNDIASAWCGIDIELDDGIVQLKHNDILTQSIQLDCLRYCRVIAIALKQWRNNGYKKTTVGSEALLQWMKSYPNWEDDFKNKINYELDEKLRKAYRGGFTWIKPSYKNKVIGDGVVIDANAMYSTIMTKYELPYGEAFKDGDDESDLYIIQVRLTAILKDNCIPCISPMDVMKYDDVSSFSKSEYLDNINNLVVWLTNYDVMLLEDNYEMLEADVLDVYYFKKKIGAFDAYLKFWYNQKINSSGSVRETSKLMYEALSGKFGTRTDNSVQVPEIDKLGVLSWSTKKLDNNKNNFMYSPLIIFVTSIARFTIINLAKKYYDRLVYVDTDSIHLIGLDIPDDIVIGQELGQYKIEAKFIKAKYIGLKNYIHDEIMNDGIIKTVTKMAGAPAYVQKQLNWNNFCSGTVVKGKPMTKQLIGGTVRYYTDYTILM